jgi:hypothetical protein
MILCQVRTGGGRAATGQPQAAPLRRNARTGWSGSGSRGPLPSGRMPVGQIWLALTLGPTASREAIRSCEPLGDKAGVFTRNARMSRPARGEPYPAAVSVSANISASRLPVTVVRAVAPSPQDTVTWLGLTGSRRPPGHASFWLPSERFETLGRPLRPVNTNGGFSGRSPPRAGSHGLPGLRHQSRRPGHPHRPRNVTPSPGPSRNKTPGTLTSSPPNAVKRARIRREKGIRWEAPPGRVSPTASPGREGPRRTVSGEVVSEQPGAAYGHGVNGSRLEPGRAGRGSQRRLGR